MNLATLTANDLSCLELLAPCDVATRLALSPTRVAQLAREGRIPAIRTPSGRRLFLQADVDAFQRTREAGRAQA